MASTAAVQITSVDQLKQIISDTFSPVQQTRTNAEEQLNYSCATNPQHPLLVLELVAASGGASGGAGDLNVRQAAAVHFKNLVKKGWSSDDDDDTTTTSTTTKDNNAQAQQQQSFTAKVMQINDGNKATIKSHLVQLMCTIPQQQIAVQLSETIALIAATDYPAQWENLLPELVTQMTSASDPTVMTGVLMTANSIFKRFRYVQRSDALYAVIKYTLEGIQLPLLRLVKQISQQVDANPADAVALKAQFEHLRLICRIFYSLNYQDLPEFFEDHMKDWMDEFDKFLKYTNPLLVDASEEDEPDCISQLQTAIIDNLALYADKDEEPFMPYLSQFTTLIWNLLMNPAMTTDKPKHDPLVVTSIKFLSRLVEKSMHKALFANEDTLRQMVLKIVIPNLTFRESDEETFEDDPHDYCQVEVEGSDSETRRKCAQDLLSAMCRQFEAETTQIAAGHVNQMLQEYQANPNTQWRAKDAAIHLMMGIAIRKQSATHGVSETNDGVNVLDFFQQQILPELQDLNHTSRPVVKATCIKFVSVFRNQFPTKAETVPLFPLLTPHLSSPVVVVHSFAAIAIERLLTTTTTTNVATSEASGTGTMARKVPKIEAADLQPFLEPLFTGLFTIVDNTDLNENDYVMKCVMRTLAKAEQQVVPVTNQVITKLTATLGRIAKNPRNPQFNHYLFESIAVLIRQVCSRDPTTVELQFEPLLFDPFTTILQMDIAEFTPYVFQLLAQLLEYRSTTGGVGLGDAYTRLFMPLLTPANWEKSGNVPALTRLVSTYVRKAANELAANLIPILGVFQKLIASKKTEGQAFDLLNTCVIHFPPAAMQAQLPTILQICLTRLQTGKTAKYTRVVTTFFACLVGKYGVDAFMQAFNQMQNGLSHMILTQVWIPRLQDDPPIVNKQEAKCHVVAMTKLLLGETTATANSSNPSLLLQTDPSVWCKAFAAQIMMLTSNVMQQASSSGSGSGGLDLEDDVLNVTYDATYSQLRYAAFPQEDFFPQVTDPSMTFAQQLHQLLRSQNDQQLMTLIQQGLNGDPKLGVGLEQMFQRAGLSLTP